MHFPLRPAHETSKNLEDFLHTSDFYKVARGLAGLLGDVFEKERLFTFSDVDDNATTQQQELMRKLKVLRPHDLGQNTPFLGIDEAKDPKDFVNIERQIFRGGRPYPSRVIVPKAVFADFTEMDEKLAVDLPGSQLIISSGYRAPAYQALLIFYNLQRYQDHKRVFSRMTLPGYSEHGLTRGTALDLDYTDAHPENYDDRLFADTPEYSWLTNNADEFGFELSYPQGNSQGIDFEPWHWRHTPIEQLD